jgi:DNA repair protein RadD
MGDSLSRVRKVRGEYDAAELSAEMRKPLHLHSALDAYRRYGEGRGKALVFAVSIEHALSLAEILSAEGPAEAVHHGLDRERRREILRGFDSGGLRFLVNVGILTEGWDSPAVDLILLCRPTMSSGLYVQMVGRGTRPHPEKADLLCLDLADNYAAHGDPSEPRVQARKGTGEGEPPLKICPECKEVIPLAAKVCPICGHVVETAEEGRETVNVSPELVEIGRGGDRRKVANWYIESYVSRRGNLMARLELFLSHGGTVNTYLDFEGQGSSFGREKARRWWRDLSGEPELRPPETVEEAVARAQAEIRIPEWVTLETDTDGYRKVKSWLH